MLVCFSCGGDRDRLKRPLMAKAVAKWADITMVTSDNPRTEPIDQIVDDVLKGFFVKDNVLVEFDRKKQ